MTGNESHDKAVVTGISAPADIGGNMTPGWPC